jgi:amino-acid N-acetyltransferase
VAPSVAETRDVLSYLSHYRGRLFVLRIADDLLGAPLFPMLVKDIVLLQRMGIRTVLVPGARHAIDAALGAVAHGTAAGATLPAGIGERRVTTETDMDTVVSASTRVANEILALLTESGARAVAGNWVRARTVGVVNGVDYQRTGRVERVDATLLSALLETDAIPIISNIGWNAVGKSYNISSLELAVAVAQSLRAAKLFLVGTAAGVTALPGTGEELATRADGFYSSIDYRAAERLLQRHRNRFNADQAALVDAAVGACAAGVDRVHVVDGRRDGILIDEIFSADGAGTMFYGDQYIHVVAAGATHVPEIMRLLQPQVDAGLLVARNASEVAERLGDYYVYQVDDTVQGCAALRLLDTGTAEIESLVVSESYRGGGTGARLVSFLLTEARRRGARRVVALTTQSADFFMEQGFAETTPDALPGGRTYDRSRNSRVLLTDL